MPWRVFQWKSAAAACLLALAASPARAQTTVRATTEDGKQVILSTDGTWRYATGANSPYVRDPSATTQIKTPLGNFAIWIDPAKWHQSSSNEAGVINFENADGTVYAKAISEKLYVPLENLEGVALHNAKSKDPNAKVVFAEHRVVNGREILCLQMEVTSSNLPFMFYGYYYGGASGTIQFITWTLKADFPASKPAMTEFLNGLVISDSGAAPAPVAAGQSNLAPQMERLPLLEGKMVLTYDKARWTQGKDEQDAGRFSFKHADGDGYGLVLTEKLEIPLDSLPGIALSNAKDAAPDARILLQEKRTVNGVQVWCLKIQGTIQGIPFIYYGYYYGGKAGTIQLLTYTGVSLFSQYEKDFSAFLNGLQIKE